MGYIKEPKGIDFTVINRNPTKEEIQIIKDRIREDNEIKASYPAIFSFDSYPGGKPSENDLLKMMKEMERIRKDRHAKVVFSTSPDTKVKKSVFGKVGKVPIKK